MNNTVRRFLVFASRGSMFAYSLSAVILPICLVEIREELGLSLTQAGALSLTAAVVQFLVLILSIPLASVWGKIRPLRWGAWIMAGGVLLFTTVGGFLAAVAVIMVIAFGQAVQEALLTPLVVDINPDDDGTHQARLHFFWPVGIVLGTLVFGVALTRGVSWRMLFLGVAILAIIMGSLYPHRSRASLPRSRTDFSHAGEILGSAHFWFVALAMFLAGGSEGGVTYWTASYIRIEYNTLPRAGGFGTAVFALGMAVGRFMTGRLATRLGIRVILLTAVMTLFAAGLGIFFSNSLPLLYVIMFIAGLSAAPLWPGLQSYSVRKLGSDPTMLMVFLSCLGVLGFSSASFLMGVVGDAAGLRMSFLLIPTFSLMLCLVVFFEGRTKKPEKRV